MRVEHERADAPPGPGINRLRLPTESPDQEVPRARGERRQPSYRFAPRTGPDRHPGETRVNRQSGATSPA